MYDKVNLSLRDEDPQRRAEAIAQLEGENDSAAVRIALSHVRRESSLELLKRIAKMARKAGSGQWSELLGSQLKQSDPMEKCRLLFVMQYLDDYDIHLLAAEQFGVEEMAVRKAALKVLNRIDKGTKLRLFKNLALHDESEKRIRAMRAIVAFKHPAIVPILKRGLKDSEYEIRQAAYQGLTTLKDASIAEAAEIIAKVPAPKAPPKIPVEEEPKAQEQDEEEDESRKKMTPIERLLSEGKTCRSCVHSKKERDDKQKMAPQRIWCSHLKKETLPAKTCLRGSWK